MSDLHAAATQLQKHLEDLHAQVAQTIAQGEQARAAVAAAHGQIEEHYAAVEARAGALRSAVHEHRQRVEGALHGFLGAAQQLGEQSDATREQVTGLLHDAQQEVQALHDHVEGEMQPALDEALQHARGVHEALGERLGAMHEELAGVVADTHDFLTGETVQHVSEMQAQVEEGHAEVVALVRDQLAPQIQQHVDDYLAQLGAAGEHLQDRIAGSRTALHEATAASMQEMLTQFAQHSDVAQQFAQQVDGTMSTLRDAIDTGGTAVANGKQVVDTGVDTASAGLQAVVDTLDELREFFGRFSFVNI